MGGNLAKSPLLGLLFAAVFVFAAVFLPFSEGYLQVLSGFAVPVLGYAFLVVYGLWAAALLALLFGGARHAGLRLMFPALFSMLGCMWAVPMAEAIWFGETTGTMTRLDCLLRLAQGGVSLAVLAVLALLLYQSPFKPAPKPAPSTPPAPATPPVPQAKAKIKLGGLAVWLLVLPVIYLIFAFCARYFLVIRNPAALQFLTGETEPRPILGELVNLLLNNARMIPLWLAEGLLLCVFLLLLLLALAEKRVLFLAVGVMMMTSTALLYLLPNPLMPGAVRMAHVYEQAAVGAVFGALSSFLLHRCVAVEKPAEPEAPDPAAKPAAKPAARTAARPAAKPAARPPAAVPAKPATK